MDATLLVLAAGMGSRFGGVKQIQPVGSHGEAIIDYSVFDAVRAGFSRVLFVVRREIERDFRSFLKSRFADVPVDTVLQEIADLPEGYSVPAERKKPWGTAHAILAARNCIHEPFAVINADDFYGEDAYRVLYDHLSRTPVDRAEYAMVGYTLLRTLSRYGSVSRGICATDKEGKLVSIEEHTKIQLSGDNVESLRPNGEILALTGKETASMNLFGFTPHVFGQLEKLFRDFLNRSGQDSSAEFYVPSAVNELLSAGEASVQVLHSDAEWFGMTYREDVPEVVARIRSLQEADCYPEALWNHS